MEKTREFAVVRKENKKSSSDFINLLSELYFMFGDIDHKFHNVDKRTLFLAHGKGTIAFLSVILTTTLIIVGALKVIEAFG